MNQIKSAVPGVIFPAIPKPDAAQQLALQFQFQQSERWSPSELLSFQFAQLKQLLVHASQYSLFYKKRFRDIGLDQSWFDRLNINSFSELPPLTRLDLQQNLEEIRVSTLPQHHGEQSETSTSGSTGTPVTTYGTAVTRAIWHAFSLRDHLWHKRNFKGKLSAIRTLPRGQSMAPEGDQTVGWGPSVDRVFHSGTSSILNVQEDTQVQFQWLLKQKADYLITHPSNLMALAKYALTEAEELVTFRQIRGVGEPVSDKLREAVRQAFGCEVSDMYSCQESGYIALQCPEESQYHVMSEGIYLEVVDDNNQPLPIGQQGRILITNLNNFATPLIRYEVGDIGVLGEPCACGRGLATLAKVLGRIRNRLITPTGTSNFPYFGYADFMKIADIKQYKIIQHGLYDIEMLLVIENELDNQQQQSISTILKKSFGYEFELRFSYHDLIPRSQSGKFEDFVSHVRIDSIEGKI